ncbi:MAG: DNA polymerase III subunit delta [Acidimicrobiales bacterium]
MSKPGVVTTTQKSSVDEAFRPAYLIRGDDPSLVAQAVQDVVSGVLGDREPSIVVEEHGALSDDVDAGAVVDALTTPPFLTDRRVVVVREAGRLLAADAARIASCLERPLPGVTLVLAGGGGTIPASLTRAAQRAGSVIDTNVGTGRARTQWLGEQIHAGPVRLDARAAATLGEHLGGDVARLRGLLDTLAAAYGEGTSVDEALLAPFLGEAGAVAPWDLSDAIDAGDTPGALQALGRLLGPAGFHPLAALGVLHRHFQAMLRLDGSAVTTPEQAAELLGLRSAFPAKKAFEQGRRLGAGRIGRAVTLLAEADLDLRGRTALPPEMVLEVLVARLSRLSTARDPASMVRGATSAGAARRRR